jgi:GDP-mannose 6-dehydrogenase
MTISIFGLGYVGTVSAACLARQGHRVIGVDVHQLKVELINDRKSPIVEAHVGEIIEDVVRHGQLTATTDATKAIAESDVSLVCVGTPSRENGSLDLDHIRDVACQIGAGLRGKTAYHVVAVRSTMLPGSLESQVLPCLQESSKKSVGRDFGLCINPEFLREGSAVTDYHNPPFTLIGAWDDRSGDTLESIYSHIEAPMIRTGIKTAEMIKYVSNAFHALKVAFANEIGLFCKRLGIDSHQVMDIFTRDTQLNISARYLKPGFAFGGSCLPKDLRALLHQAKMLDLELPMLGSLLPSNDHHVDHAFGMIRRSGAKRVGIVGLSFKAGTDDLRESPMVRLAELLIGKGFDLRILDRNVSLARILGANKHYIEHTIPHLSTLLVKDHRQLLDHAELVVIGSNTPDAQAVLHGMNGHHQVIDLVRAIEPLVPKNGKYQGICW